MIDLKGITKYKFCADLGVSKGFLDKPREITTDRYANILEYFPDINENWLLKGDGEIFKPEANDNAVKYKAGSTIAIFKPENLPLQVGKLYRAPIYHSFPVSAGNMGLSAVRIDTPDSYCYTTMAGVVFFPVVGCSFEPVIKAGRYIGVVKVDRWDRLDTEKIYFIVTHDDRMIKRLRTDDGDDNILWCVSPNFSEFKIYKTDIIEISHVFFYGTMV